MTESEAIEKLKNMRLFMQITDENSEHKFPQDYYKANEMAIQALEEVQKYRAIGTPEECRAAVEKQKAKKPIYKHYEDNGEPPYIKISCPNGCRIHLFLFIDKNLVY